MNKFVLIGIYILIIFPSFSSCGNDSRTEKRSSIDTIQDFSKESIPQIINLGTTKHNIENNLKSKIISNLNPTDKSVFEKKMFFGKKLFYNEEYDKAIFFNIKYPLIIIENIFLTNSFYVLTDKLEKTQSLSNYNFIKNNKLYNFTNNLTKNEIRISPFQYEYNDSVLTCVSDGNQFFKYNEIQLSNLDTIIYNNKDNYILYDGMPYLKQKAKSKSKIEKIILKGIYNTDKIRNNINSIISHNEMDNYEIKIQLLVNKKGNIEDLNIKFYDNINKKNFDVNNYPIIVKNVQKELYSLITSNEDLTYFIPATSIYNQKVNSLYIFNFNLGFKNIQ